MGMVQPSSIGIECEFQERFGGFGYCHRSAKDCSRARAGTHMRNLPRGAQCYKWSSRTTWTVMPGCPGVYLCDEFRRSDAPPVCRQRRSSRCVAYAYVGEFGVV